MTLPEPVRVPGLERPRYAYDVVDAVEQRQATIAATIANGHHPPPPPYLARLAHAVRLGMSTFRVADARLPHDAVVGIARTIESDLAGPPVTEEVFAVADAEGEPHPAYEREACDDLAWRVWEQCAVRGLAPAQRLVIVRHRKAMEPTVRYVCTVATRRLV